jgi:hypothetical protein
LRLGCTWFVGRVARQTIMVHEGRLDAGLAGKPIPCFSAGRPGRRMAGGWLWAFPAWPGPGRRIHPESHLLVLVVMAVDAEKFPVAAVRRVVVVIVVLVVDRKLLEVLPENSLVQRAQTWGTFSAPFRGNPFPVQPGCAGRPPLCRHAGSFFFMLPAPLVRPRGEASQGDLV